MALQRIAVQPGIQRDGTKFDSVRYTDGEWVRFQRGRPKKMGGYRRISDRINGPVYGIHVWNRQSTNLVTTFSGSGIEQIQVDDQFVGAVIKDRTPANWSVNDNVLWQFATLYDDAFDSNRSLILAHGGQNMRSIDEGIATPVYYADANGSDKFVPMGSEWNVSGGIVAAAPYFIAYGSDGQVIWSNQNEPRNNSTGDSGRDRITDKKIVKGLQIRGAGKSPSVLLWSLDSVIRMSYIGGAAVFQFDTLTSESSVLSTNSIIEYDGLFFWAGVDRFMVFNGSVQELPNDTNLNYFFDNLNFAQRQKVFAMKMPRYGEIWWFYPRIGEDECSQAVIYNVREKVWYDAKLNRTAGSSSQTVRHPLMTDSEATFTTVLLRLSGITGKFLYGDTVVGQFSGAKGRVAKVTDSDIYLKEVEGQFRDDPFETVTGPNGTGTITDIANTTQYSLWMHEFGNNKIVGDDELSISSYIETCNISVLGGSATQPPADANTRISKIEPDFVGGEITFNILHQKNANSPLTKSRDYRLAKGENIITMREQGRVLYIRMSNDTLNGDYELGKVLIDIEPGDQKV